MTSSHFLEATWLADVPEFNQIWKVSGQVSLKNILVLRPFQFQKENKLTTHLTTQVNAVKCFRPCVAIVYLECL